MTRRKPTRQRLVGSLVEHKLWPKIAPYLKVEIYARDGGHKYPRRRLELLDGDMPPKLLRQALKIEVACCHCANPIHPFRARQKGTGRAEPRHVYCAVACPLSVSVGCSRGAPARDEYIRIELALLTLGGSGS